MVLSEMREAVSGYGRLRLALIGRGVASTSLAGRSVRPFVSPSNENIPLGLSRGGAEPRRRFRLFTMRDASAEQDSKSRFNPPLQPDEIRHEPFQKTASSGSPKPLSFFG